jgi:hypothetical protein
LSRNSNQIARGRIRRFESYMPSQPVRLQRVTYEGCLQRRSRFLRDQRKAEAEAGRRMVRCTTQPSTKAAQTPCAASPRPRAASGHRSVSNTAGINGTPLLTCHQMISGQVARTNSAAPSRIHANKRQRLRIISPQSSTVCAPGWHGESHKSGDKTVMAITESRISHREHLFRARSMNYIRTREDRGILGP